FNDFPQGENEFRMNGRLVFGSNMWASNASGENFGAGAMDLSNSDIFGLNGLFFNDVADNDGEGLQFLQTGKSNGSTNRNDYDTFRIRDGLGMINGTTVLSNHMKLWEGGAYMQASQTIYPSKALSQ